MEDLREMGDSAAWSLSSAKPGNGVEQLRDGSVETFWQSDGAQPHLVNIQFPRKVRVSEVRIYASFKIDESYTPAGISVRIGTAHHDLQEVQVVDLKEPEGWISIRLAQVRGDPTALEPTASCAPRDHEVGGAIDFVRAHFVQLAILSNHQNGRDTHLRQVQVWGPRAESFCRPATVPEARPIQFQTSALQQFACIR